MAKYKHYKFKEVIDWQGEAWDVYEEYKSPSGIMIYRGWPYGLTPKDGICGIFSYIFTPEIAEFIQTHYRIRTTTGFIYANGGEISSMVRHHPKTYSS